MCESDSVMVQQGIADMTYYDESIGGNLYPRLIQAGKAEEIQRFAKIDVYGYEEGKVAYDDLDGI